MIADLLPRLDEVKETKPRQFIACCPAHKDKKPSLGIKELKDGKVLVNCWAGCDKSDILSAIGLNLSYLYPTPEPKPQKDVEPVMPSWEREEFIKFMNSERLIVAIFKADVKANYFKTKDLNRYFLAIERVRKLEGMLNE